jgi:hypothetical protein
VFNASFTCCLVSAICSAPLRLFTGLQAYRTKPESATGRAYSTVQKTIRVFILKKVLAIHTFCQVSTDNTVLQSCKQPYKGASK